MSDIDVQELIEVMKDINKKLDLDSPLPTSGEAADIIEALRDEAKADEGGFFEEDPLKKETFELLKKLDIPIQSGNADGTSKSNKKKEKSAKAEAAKADKAKKTDTAKVDKTKKAEAAKMKAEAEKTAKAEVAKAKADKEKSAKAEAAKAKVEKEKSVKAAAEADKTKKKKTKTTTPKTDKPKVDKKKKTATPKKEAKSNKTKSTGIKCPDSGVIKILAKENPYRKGSKVFDRFKLAKDGMKVSKYVEKGGTKSHIWHFTRAGHVKVVV